MKKIILSLIFLSILGCNDKYEIKKLNFKTDSLQTELVKNNNQFDSINILYKSLLKQKDYWFDEEYEGRIFTNIGVKNPKEFIISSLRNKPELIPIEAVLGGTMRFGKIQVLSNEWLIADYNDGHIQGKAIFSFKLSNKGELEFKLIKSIIP